MTALGERIFRLVSLAVRFALILGAIAVVIVTLTDLGAVEDLLGKAAWMKDHDPGALLAWPPVWFVSMYECLIGRGSPFYEEGARRGLIVLGGLLIAGLLAMAAALRRFDRRAGEVRTARAGLGKRLARSLSGACDRILFRSQPEKAAFHFLAGTLRKSGVHKVRLAGWSALSLGMTFLLAGVRGAVWTNPAKAGLGVLGAPLALGVFILLGLRAAFDVPYAGDAGWIYRLTERANPGPYFTAMKKLIAFGWLLPLAGLTFLIHFRLWGMGPAALHGLYALAWLMLIGQALFWKYARIPFVCKVVPGKAKLHLTWLPLTVGFVAGLGLLASWEKSLLRTPIRFGLVLAALAAVIIGLEIVQRRFIYPRLALVYEEEPEPIMVSLG